MINMSNTHNHINLKSGLQYFNTSDAQIALDYECATEHPTHLFILVNGFQRTRLDFRAFRKKLMLLAPHVATVSLDNRYCGETKVTEDSELTCELMSQDVLAISKLFMEKLNLTNFSLLGISMGGMIAQHLASTMPQHVIQNLFLVSTTCGGVGRTWSRPIEHPSQLKYENKNVDIESTQKNMSRFFANKFLKNSPFLFEMMCKNILKSDSKNGQRNEIAAKKQYEVSVQFDVSSMLSNIQAQKTIIISGEEDRIILLANSQYLHQHIQDSQLIVYPEVGHLILIEEPENFVKDVASYFL
jgi:pimeloyl-ACP methyl ester carboxylesterase